MSDILQRVRLANPIFDADEVDPAEFEMALASIEDRWQFGDASRRVSTATRTRWLRPVLVAVGAAILAIIVLAAPMLFLRGDEQPVSDTSIPPPTTTTQIVTTTVPVTTTTAPTVPLPLPLAPAMNWQRVPDDPIFDEAWIRTIVVGGPGVIAAGGYGPSELGWPVDAAVWTSNDGLTWESIDEASFIGNAPDAGEPWGANIFDLASGPLGIIGGGNFGQDAAIWVSGNGMQWERADDDDLVSEGGSGVLGLAAGGPGWIAVGDIGVDGGVWVSEDGLAWTRVEDDDLLAGDRVDVTLYDVATWNDGLIAVGTVGLWDGTGNQAARGAVWVSQDGIEWQELAEESFAEVRVFESVSVDPSTGIAFVFGSPGGVWNTTDGTMWDVTRFDDLLGGPPPSSGVAWDGGRAVAGGPDMALSLWTSGDSGTTWLRVDADDTAFDGYSPGVGDVTRFGERFIAVGRAGDYMEEVGAIWIGSWDQ